MTIDITTKYISDDGMIFTSEEDCIKWENAEKVYILKEKCVSSSRILGVFKSKKLAENEKRKYVITEYTEYFIDSYIVL